MIKTSSAHPMLEPINYDIDPDTASNILSGDMLSMYNLLWKAAVATQADGPVVRKHKLYTRIASNASLSANWIEIIESGWMALLPNETPTSFLNVEYSLNSSESLNCFVPQYQTDVLSMKQSSNDLDLTISPQSTVSSVVKQIPPKIINYSYLLGEMAKYKVARPSTYANRIESTLNNGLISKKNDELYLSNKGNGILDLIQNLSKDEQLNKELSFQVENAIDDIEMDPSKAGTYLNEFCQKLLGKSSNLSTWLDELDVGVLNFDEESEQKLDDINKTLKSDKPDSELDCIMASENANNAIQHTEHEWDDYSFKSTILQTKFIGRLYTRKARRLDVSKNRIFKEHLIDYNQIVQYCLIKYVPYIEDAIQIKFTIQTDRTKGILYLLKMKIHYRDLFYVVQERDELREDIINELKDKLNYVCLFGANYLDALWHEEPMVIFD